jgi:DeoR family transcriptional regulator, suf operon transcriptional repressor
VSLVVRILHIPEGETHERSTDITTLSFAYSMPTDRTRSRKSTHGAHAGAFNLLGTARGQILSELCGQRLTAIEVAKRFRISSNAARMHLSGLREAGLVRYDAVSRGVGKPTHVYELTAAGQYFVSRAYAPALSLVIGAIRARGPAIADEIVREAGRALASAQGDVGEPGNLERRAKRCVAILRALGGRAKVVKGSHTLTIRGECCPLAAVVADQPTACKLFEGLACEITGHEVHEQCERAHRVHCEFVIAT